MQGKAQDRRLGPAVLRAIPLCALAALAACAGGMDLDRMGVDRSIVTGSVTGSDDPENSDKAAISAAISEWPPDLPAPQAMPWVNIRTGSSGAITDLGAAADAGCRDFRASREAFDGVAVYRGRACRAAGPWVVRSLDRS